MSGGRPPPPELPIVAERVAHDLRGFIGLLVSALHELTELQTPRTDSALPRGLTAPELLQMAGRVTCRLERVAARLDAVAHHDRFPPAHVDLEPLIKDAVAHAVRSERRAEVTVTLPIGGVTRVCVVPQASVEAIEDLVAWALKRSRRPVSLTVDLSSTEAVQILVTAVGVTVIPAMSVPFQDPLGMANWLLLRMGGSLHAEVAADKVTLVASLPRGSAGGA
jgi:hypothetical protein